MTATVVRTPLTDLVTRIRAVVARGLTDAETAEQVANYLRPALTLPGLLTEEQRQGSADGYTQHVLHVEETETLYRLAGRKGRRKLVVSGHTVNRRGTVSGIAPPGDIHHVSNSGTTTAISLHVYGADIGRLGSSIRRCYDVVR